MPQTISTISTDHIDLISSKDYETTVTDLAAQLGRSSTQELELDRLAATPDWKIMRRSASDRAARAS